MSWTWLALAVVVVVVGVVATMREVLRDGYGVRPPPRSHEADLFEDRAGHGPART